MLGRVEDALRINRDVYSGYVKLKGEEHGDTCAAAYNCASALSALKRFDEIKALLPRAIPAARSTLGESHELTLSMRGIHAKSLYEDDRATLDELREAVTTLEDAGRIARRVLGGAHPLTLVHESNLQDARAALRARETPPTKGES